MLNRRLFLGSGLAAFAAAKVKITGVDVYPIRIPVTRDEAAAGLMHAFTVAAVTTDAGVTGYSFGWGSCRRSGSYWLGRTCSRLSVTWITGC